MDRNEVLDNLKITAIVCIWVLCAIMFFLIIGVASGSMWCLFTLTICLTLVWVLWSVLKNLAKQE